jgi:excisionase family DNA binding protein
MDSKPHPEPQRLVYRVGELAPLLAISEVHLRRQIAAGVIPSLRFGRSVRVPAWWVEAALRAGTA